MNNFMAKKKILVFIDWFLPGYRAGGPIQSCANMIEHLKDEFDFSIVTRDTDYCETNSYPNIKNNEWNFLPNGTRVFYFSSDKLNSSAMKKIIQSAEYDIAYLNGIYSYQFTILPLFFLKRKNKKIIIAVRGMLADGAVAQKKFKKRIFLFIAKTLGLFNKVTFQASSEKEKEEVKKYFGEKISIQVAPNLPKKNISTNNFHRAKMNGELRLINIARIAPEKNFKFALEILKEIKGKVVFDFYGPIYNKTYWQECEQIIRSLSKNISANYRGSVESHLISKILSEYHFLFMPSLGENFGHIILEALSCGCPVIISDQTPWKNLEEKNLGWDIFLSDQKKIVAIIEKCIAMKQGEYDLLSSSSYKFASSFINNPEMINLNRALFT